MHIYIYIFIYIYMYTYTHIHLQGLAHMAFGPENAIQMGASGVVFCMILLSSLIQVNTGVCVYVCVYVCV